VVIWTSILVIAGMIGVEFIRGVATT
jgi:hypothetical protein